MKVSLGSRLWYKNVFPCNLASVKFSLLEITIVVVKKLDQTSLQTFNDIYAANSLAYYHHTCNISQNKNDSAAITHVARHLQINQSIIILHRKSNFVHHNFYYLLNSPAVPPVWIYFSYYPIAVLYFCSWSACHTDISFVDVAFRQYVKSIISQGRRQYMPNGRSLLGFHRKLQANKKISNRKKKKRKTTIKSSYKQRILLLSETRSMNKEVV